MIRQTEASECGLACLAMVANHHGYESDLASLRRRFAISLKGSTLKGLVQIASSMGLGSRAVRCELSALGELKLPAILHWDMNHFVVLSKGKRRLGGTWVFPFYEAAPVKRTASTLRERASGVMSASASRTNRLSSSAFTKKRRGANIE